MLALIIQGAMGYSVIYMLLGGGFIGAIIIFMLARLLCR